MTLADWRSTAVVRHFKHILRAIKECFSSPPLFNLNNSITQEIFIRFKNQNVKMTIKIL